MSERWTDGTYADMITRGVDPRADDNVGRYARALKRAEEAEAQVAALWEALAVTVQGCEVCGGTGMLCPERRTPCTNCFEARAALAHGPAPPPAVPDALAAVTLCAALAEEHCWGSREPACNCWPCRARRSARQTAREGQGAEPCEHEKVYSDRVLLTHPPQRPWICRKCRTEGAEFFGQEAIAEAAEYWQLKQAEETP